MAALFTTRPTEVDRQVTDGKWEIRSIQGVDEAKGYLYFTGTEASHIAPNAYRIKLDGTELTRLTQGAGGHRVDFNPTFTHFVHYWSDINTRTGSSLRRERQTRARARG